ncbi:MAG: type II toxin-antitoxin system RelE/ParE family toxin [Desulfovibrionales bacterium]|nr:type II toxin-antitoxin system RelE/ParE family toxin [Desulfovibrionales bacterium]
MTRKNIILTTEHFNKWLRKLKDIQAKTRIIARIKNAEKGNFGDVKPVGEGLSEMRVFIGAGYRIYYTQKEDITYLLLMGGDKSTQKQDIAKAKRMAKELGLLP